MLLCDVVQFVVEVVHLNKQRTGMPEKFGERLVGWFLEMFFADVD